MPGRRQLTLRKPLLRRHDDPCEHAGLADHGGREIAWGSKRPLSASEWQATQLLLALIDGLLNTAGSRCRWKPCQAGVAVMLSGSFGEVNLNRCADRVSQM
jgi:hypothetical protein